MPRCRRHGLACCDGTPRSARIRRTVSQASPLSALSSTSIRVPSQAPTRQASMSPNATPTGVLTSRIGFAIRIVQKYKRCALANHQNQSALCRCSQTTRFRILCLPAVITPAAPTSKYSLSAVSHSILSQPKTRPRNSIMHTRNSCCYTVYLGRVSGLLPTPTPSVQ